jgi:hypothetical protein
MQTLTVARQTWLRRNCFVFENFLMTHLQVLEIVQSTLAAFKEAHDSVAKENNGLGQVQIRWKKTPMCVTKFNWDATLNKDTKTMGVGVVARDEKGEFVAGFSNIVPYIVDPLTTKLVAV